MINLPCILAFCNTLWVVLSWSYLNSLEFGFAFFTKIQHKINTKKPKGTITYYGDCLCTSSFRVLFARWWTWNSFCQPDSCVRPSVYWTLDFLELFVSIGLFPVYFYSTIKSFCKRTTLAIYTGDWRWMYNMANHWQACKSSQSFQPLLVASSTADILKTVQHPRGPVGWLTLGYYKVDNVSSVHLDVCMNHSIILHVFYLLRVRVRNTLWTCQQLFELWDEPKVPSVNPCSHRKTLKLHRKAPTGLWTSNPLTVRWQCYSPRHSVAC